jgi:very-long-chain (3R)-3-hydroxyacyl-CoA dehydratase
MKRRNLPLPIFLSFEKSGSHSELYIAMRKVYLTTYNAIFAALWFTVLLATIHHLTFSSKDGTVFTGLARPTRMIQTVSLLDILHSATGIIPAPLGSTFTQVATRVIQTWLVWYAFPESTADSYAFPALVIAWSAADGVRYIYLALNMHDRAPRWLLWTRYSMFYVLYPIGIGAEWWLMMRAAGPAGEINKALLPVFWFLLALYVPGEPQRYCFLVVRLLTV